MPSPLQSLADLVKPVKQSHPTKLMEQALAQAAKSSALVEQNKARAREHLLAISLLLNNRPLK